MTAKKTHRSTNEYLKYLKGELTPEERHAFERDLEADPFEREAMEGMEGLPADALEEDLLAIHAALQRRLRRRKRRTWYYVAATVASILIVGTVFLNIYEIDPGTTSESIPADESFLPEETFPEAIQAEMEDGEKAIDDPGLNYQALEDNVREDAVREDAVREDAVREDAVREDAGKEDLAMEDLDREIDVAAPVAQKAVAPEAMAPEAVAPEAVAPEAAPEEAAREIVSVEAQPRRSQRKGRALEAPMVAPESAVAGRVSGVVISAEDMEPLPGASLVVKGSDSGVVSDQLGRFALVTDPREPATVIASYVGMETGEYRLAGDIENRLVMRPDPAVLDEVVVVGYDADKSVHATGAVQRMRLDQEEYPYSGAEPEGGLEAYKMYVEEQIRFPAGDTLSKREVVVLKFNVARDGSISDIQALRSPGNSFTEEAIRLLQQGPAWKPARNESGATEDVVRMRIVFTR